MTLLRRGIIEQEPHSIRVELVEDLRSAHRRKAAAAAIELSLRHGLGEQTNPAGETRDERAERLAKEESARATALSAAERESEEAKEAFAALEELAAVEASIILSTGGVDLDKGVIFGLARLDEVP